MASLRSLNSLVTASRYVLVSRYHGVNAKLDLNGDPDEQYEVKCCDCYVSHSKSYIKIPSINIWLALMWTLSYTITLIQDSLTR
jgi:hypothetical protein